MRASAVISRRQAPVALAGSSRPGSLAARCFCRQQQPWQSQQQQQQRRPQTTAAAGAPSPRPVGGTGATSRVVSGAEANDELLLQLEEEYSTLKVNWFPGHMVKATKVIREKLKQVDMVFEVRDARIPFTSANDDLDKIVGPSKARLIVLNKADLSNQALEQRVLQRFKEQGKTAVYACGRTGANVNKLLTWARERGARRGEFSTTGAVAMVVGMPNVGKSSLINLLRGKANSRGRGKGRGEGGGSGESAKQVARVGAMPGVTRQVSAFRIGSTPPLYLVDTPGVMVPRVHSVTAGLCLALTRAVPDSVVPPDILVGFMLRVVRSRRLHGAKGAKGSLAWAEEGFPRPAEGGATLATSGRDTAARRPRQQPRRSKAIIAWLLDLEGGAGPDADISDALVPSRPPVSDGDGGGTGWQGGTAARTDTPNRQQPPSPREQQPHRHRLGSDDELTHFGGSVEEEEGEDQRMEREEMEREDDMEALLEAVARESGAEGKPAPEARRICCRYLLDAFRDGQFGRITLDSVPRVSRGGKRGNFSEILSSEFSAQVDSEVASGWRTPPSSPPPQQQQEGIGGGGSGLAHQESRWEAVVGGGGDGPGAASAATAARRKGSKERVVRTPAAAADAGKRSDRRRPKQQRQQPPALADNSDLADRLVRDWSNPDAWERTGAQGRS